MAIDVTTAPTSSPGTPGRVAISLLATSVGSPVVRLAQQGPLRLSLLSQHHLVSNLVTPAGDLVAVVGEALGPGPFNVVVPAWARPDLPPSDTPAGHLVDNRLQLGSLVIHWHPSVVWDPQPDWLAIGQSAHLINNLDTLRAWFRHQPPFGGAQVDGATAAALRKHTTRVVTTQAVPNLYQALAGLMGLGPGLTPLGDDWLAGWLLRLHLSPRIVSTRFDLPGQRPGDIITAFVVERAANRTTRLSQAWLRAAAAGWVDESWLRLLHTLAASRSADLDRAAGCILRHGVTSGYAMLAGFLQEILS